MAAVAVALGPLRGGVADPDKTEGGMLLGQRAKDIEALTVRSLPDHADDDDVRALVRALGARLQAPAPDEVRLDQRGGNPELLFHTF